MEDEAKLMDLTNPKHEVSIQFTKGETGTGTLWVNVDGFCRLRITGVKSGITTFDLNGQKVRPA
jgi:hypothetical protein